MEDEKLDFYCSRCDTPFRGIVWSVDRAHERTHFLEPLPEVEIIDSSSIDCYCSRQCLELGVAPAMAREQVPIPALRPDIGPIETCAICRTVVDMSEFHLAYSMSRYREAGWAMQPLWYDLLAVVCNRCRPLSSAAAWREPTVQHNQPPAHLGGSDVTRRSVPRVSTALRRGAAPEQRAGLQLPWLD